MSPLASCKPIPCCTCTYQGEPYLRRAVIHMQDRLTQLHLRLVLQNSIELFTKLAAVQAQNAMKLLTCYDIALSYA